MTLFVLDNDVQIRATRMRAGKVIDSNLYDVNLLKAAGAVLVPATATALARSAALLKVHRGGESPDFQTANMPGRVADAVVPQSGGIERVTSANSPYAIKANTKVVVDASGGNVVLNAPVLAAGESFTVKVADDAAIAGNTITVNAGAGQQLGQPAPNNGIFTGALALAGAGQVGAEYTWTNTGAANGKLSLE